MRRLLTGRRILDGTGAAPFPGAVLVHDQTIEQVFRGPVPHIGPIDECHDAADKVICPGFVDLHTHSDVSVLSDAGCVSAIGQGITTQVVGHCGFSAAPVSARTRSDMVDEEPVFGFPGVEWTWNGVAEYLDAVRAAAPATNIATLVGHGTVRRLVMGGADRAADEVALTAMGDLVLTALEDGAIGLSTGLSYAPGMYADEQELEHLARITARRHRRYHTHLRYGGIPIRQTVAEAIRLAEKTGVAVNISHLYPAVTDPPGTAELLLGDIESARARGLDVTFDLTVFRRGGGAWMQALPGWARDGGMPPLLRRIADPTKRGRIIAHLDGRATDWDDQLIVKVAHPENGHLVGRTIGALARERRQAPAHTALDLVRQDGQFWVAPHIKRQADLDLMIAHPLCVPITDGMAAHPVTHRPLGLMPKTFGTTALVLGDYVRTRGVLTLPDAVARLTGMAADRAGLSDRGRLQPGLAADIVVFDPQRIANTATDERPGTPPDGVHQVMVNGMWALNAGRPTDTRSGHVLMGRGR